MTPRYYIRKTLGRWFLFDSEARIISTTDTFPDIIADLDFELRLHATEPCS